MILITISFSYHWFPHLGCCSCINCWTCPHLWYHQESESKWLFSLLFARRKNLISVSSFACWYCPLPQTCLACAYTQPLSTCSHWYVVLVFTVELVRIFVNINRATSGFLHCYLLLEKSVSVSSSSIKRQVLSLEKLVLVVLLFARWNHCPLPQTWLACEYVHCRL